MAKYVVGLQFYKEISILVEADSDSDAQAKAKNALRDDSGNDYRLAKLAEENGYIGSNISFSWEAKDGMYDEEEISEMFVLEEDEE